MCRWSPDTVNGEQNIKDLIEMIDLTIRWIESEVETKRLLDEMPLL